ncbi:MAG: protein translocase subunit SecD [Oligoflexia bacterium]|nr:protein translocase subunit SecD [Oligoflexia bacterium]
MKRIWWAKFWILMIITTISVLYVYPTLSNLNPDTSKFPVKKKVNLGLDLQGGLYMVFEIDIKKLFKENMERQLESLKVLSTSKALPSQWRLGTYSEEDDPRGFLTFEAAQTGEIKTLLKDYYPNMIILGEKAGELELALTLTNRNDIRDNAVRQSIEVIRNRIDTFGVTEPGISSQGSKRVVVELPGVREIERAKQLIGRTAKLEFKIVNDSAMQGGQIAALVASIEKDHGVQYKEGQKFSEYVEKINEFAKGKIPEDSEIVFEKTSRGSGPNVPATWVPYLLFKKVDVTGNDLQDARMNIDQDYGRPIVEFQMNPAGAAAMKKVTGENKQKRLAIVLDNVVYSAPVIQSEISTNGQITLGQGNHEELMKEAKDLSIVLRAGALPAQLDLVEQRVIGPSLGQDSIRQGLTAGIVGCALIFIFMSFYYRASGLVAVLSLMLNGLFAFAALVSLDATLTLPGIAGLALTIGMAVDSNVIIFERIRDELQEGKSPARAIEAGFDKAFSSIFDANITHGIVAIILLQFGTGPIKGFAVTLLIGIVTTLFTAVTVCKLIFDGYIAFKKGELKSLSI